MASVLVKGYLLAYNGVMFVGWLQVLCPALCYTATHTNTLARMEGYLPGFYNQMRWPLLVFQTAAVLEVLHCMFGLVRSAVTTTLMQVYSRLFVVWMLMEGVAGVSDSVGALLVAYAWGITEIIRYAFYFCSLVNLVPYPLVWFRYTLFYGLYPLGVLGEMLLFFASLPVVKARGQWNLRLPNMLNCSFNFYYFLIFTMLLYIPLFPQLYGHMIKQRAKIIGGTKTDAQKKEN